MAAGTTWLALGLLVATQGFDPAAAATKQLRSQDFAATILASEFAVVMFMDPASAHRGSAGAGVKGISDPLAASPEPLRESLYGRSLRSCYTNSVWIPFTPWSIIIFAPLTSHPF